MRNQIIAVVGCTSFLMVGCATVEERHQQRVASIPEAERAYVIGTFASDCRLLGDRCVGRFTSYGLQYRSDDGEWQDELTLGRYAFLQDTKYDFSSTEREEQGINFCIPLKQGKYGFYGFHYYAVIPRQTTYSVPKTKEFKLPFELKAGEIAYLGKLKLTASTGKNIFGFDVPVPGNLLLSSQPAAAMKAALQNCPESVRTWPVKDATLRASDAGSPFVQTDLTN